MEEKRKASRTAKTSSDGSEGRAAARPANRFHNFEERDYDYDALLRQMEQGSEQG